MKAVLSAIFLLITLPFLPQTLLAEEPSTLQELEKQAADGSLEAQMDLAQRYYKGAGVEQDFTKAANWFKRLAEQDFAQAQLTLGLMYIRGEGVERDDAKAVEWLKEAASQRLVQAQYLLGIAYEEGHGVEVDLPTAYMWYEIAAALNYANAEAAQKRIADKLSDKEINQAEQDASQWWLQHHH